MNLLLSALCLLSVFFQEPAFAAQEENQTLQSRAASGDVLAQLELGSQYANGSGVEQDFSQAKKWWEQAAAKGNAQAQFNLGFMYEKGAGVPVDLPAAQKWWDKAASQGHLPAIYNLGMLYIRGEGGVQGSYENAVKYFQLGALQNHPQSQFNLGVMYDKGMGIPQDSLLGYAWVALAAEQEHPLAKEYEAQMRQGLTPEQLTAAQEQIIRIKTELSQASAGM